MLTSAGMTIGDVRLVSMNPEEIEDSMPESIQAGQTWEPFTAQALANGNNILYSTKDTGSVFPDLIVFRKNVITERPDDIQAFVNAWFDAVEFRLTNPDEANQIISQAIGSEVSQTAGDPKLFTRADNLAVLSTNPGEGKRYIYGVLALNIDFLKSIGGLTFPVDPQVILDPTFMQNAGD
jgi:NitT/TauT family transport system substrate-binding protein